MSENTTAMGQVDELALELLDKGRFATKAEARNYVFESRPELATKVRAEAEAEHLAKSVRKAAPAVGGAWAEVEKQARLLVEVGAQPSMVQARGHVYETQPKLAAAVRAESA